MQLAMLMRDGLSSLLIFARGQRVGRERAKRSSGNAVLHVLSNAGTASLTLLVTGLRENQQASLEISVAPKSVQFCLQFGDSCFWRLTGRAFRFFRRAFRFGFRQQRVARL